MASNRLSALAIFVYMASACQTGDDSATCLASQKFVEEVEDVNDGDMIMHLQMRVGVDPAAEEPPQPHSGAVMEQHEAHPAASAPVHKALPIHAKPLQHTVPLQQPEQQPELPTRQQVASTAPSSFNEKREKDVVRAFGDHTVLPLLQVYAQALPVYQCVTVLAILVACFALCKLMNIVEKTVIRDRHTKLEGFDASAKLQQMLQALRFEPPEEDETPPWSKEMQNVMTVLPVKVAEKNSSEHDDIIKDAEEPETEPVEPEPEAAVNGMAFAEMAKQRGRDVCQQIANEGQRFAMEGKKMLTPRSAEKQNQIGLKVKVITC